MCEFCTSHGEGKKWYENIRNYTAEVFHQASSEAKARAFLGNLPGSMRTDVPLAWKWKNRFPRIYRLIAYPLITRHLKKTHFGQIVPIEDLERLLNHFGSLVRLPCVCRKVTTGEEKRYCMGIGMDLTPLYSDLPDLRNFERLSRAEAITFLRHLDREGMTHSVWTLNTPFIAAICNCDRDCMAYRFQVQMKLGKAMWKGEYVARIDPLNCNGCGECQERCYFEAITYDRRTMKCMIDETRCYGCGICRAGCCNGAVDLLDRTAVPLAAVSW